MILLRAALSGLAAALTRLILLAYLAALTTLAWLPALALLRAGASALILLGVPVFLAAFILLLARHIILLTAGLATFVRTGSAWLLAALILLTARRALRAGPVPLLKVALR